MKKLSLLSLIFVVFMICGCDKKLGGYMYRDIYVMEEDELLDGQDYLISFPKAETTIEIQIVAYGETILCDSKAEWLTIKKTGEAETLVYDKDDRFKDGWHVQKFTVTATPNDKKVKRKTSAFARCMIFNGFAANFRIEQAGK